MPLYEFACADCSVSFEELVVLSARETTKVVCPKCGSKDIQKRISTFASRVGKTVTPESPCATGGCCLNGSCGL